MRTVGDTFGRWTIIAKGHNKDSWLCRCTCGVERSITGKYLKGRVHCQNCDISLYANTRYTKFAHVISRKLFRKLSSIVGAVLQRCGVHPNYILVKVHAPWCDDPLAFIEYLLTLEGYERLGNRASDLTLDRVDNDGHYEPGNLRFVTRSVQNNNRRVRFSDADTLIRAKFSKSIYKLHAKGCNIAEIANLYVESLSTIRRVLKVGAV